ncbi:hypothetical protein JOF56_002087 [Kibdelosporangium banguiense]|uniref:DUF397 domain-containing protein n=1 Tax=Kibdelosporangium banguiense TaxID=1365924 RepID=A0ABS4TBC7_9PSEU|nr:DUF397 domain-containing protein [Kibdelosporangium banguiense]MBP2321702.1 hypothetical protein [Kibdelosporangium banguiense]
MDNALLRWRKSSFSGNAGGENTGCVEVAHVLSALLTGGHSTSNSGCVEPARNPLTRLNTQDTDCIQPARNPLTQPRTSDPTCVEPAAAVRDSKAPDTGMLTFPTAPWGRFLQALING